MFDTEPSYLVLGARLEFGATCYGRAVYCFPLLIRENSAIIITELPISILES
jgi:hypothetical protein